MISLKLNPDTNDLVMDDLNGLVMVEGSEEIAQRLRLSIITQAGEWFLNNELGIDWIRLLGKKAKKEEITNEIRRKLVEDPAVEKVDYITFEDLGKRSAKITFGVHLTNNYLTVVAEVENG
jgi:hypothetical protein